MYLFQPPVSSKLIARVLPELREVFQQVKRQTEPAALLQRALLTNCQAKRAAVSLPQKTLPQCTNSSPNDGSGTPSDHEGSNTTSQQQWLLAIRERLKYFDEVGGSLQAVRLHPIHGLGLTKRALQHEVNFVTRLLGKAENCRSLNQVTIRMAPGRVAAK